MSYLAILRSCYLDVIPCVDSVNDGPNRTDSSPLKFLLSSIPTWFHSAQEFRTRQMRCCAALFVHESNSTSADAAKRNAHVSRTTDSYPRVHPCALMSTAYVYLH